jgi:hypothetical protein
VESVGSVLIPLGPLLLRLCVPCAGRRVLPCSTAHERQSLLGSLAHPGGEPKGAAILCRSTVLMWKWSSGHDVRRRDLTCLPKSTIFSCRTLACTQKVPYLNQKSRFVLGFLMQVLMLSLGHSSGAGGEGHRLGLRGRIHRPHGTCL